MVTRERVEGRGSDRMIRSRHTRIGCCVISCGRSEGCSTRDFDNVSRSQGSKRLSAQCFGLDRAYEPKVS
jgi:hypothetical protein